MNPCPCSYLGDPRHACKCQAPQIERYMGKISGPLLDRIDLHIEVPGVPFQELSANADGTSSATMRAQVSAARAVQQKRFGADGALLNSRMSTRQLRRQCVLDEEGKGLLKAAWTNWGCRRGRTTASCAWPAPSPTWRGRRTSRRRTSSRPSATAASTANSGPDRKRR
jgi:magnesium chelatase family protein